LERIDESARWMEQRRKTVHFSPGKISDVQEWEKTVKTKLDDTPLGKYLKIQNKTRSKRRQLVEKARLGEDEILEDWYRSYICKAAGTKRPVYIASDIMASSYLSIQFHVGTWLNVRHLFTFTWESWNLGFPSNPTTLKPISIYILCVITAVVFSDRLVDSSRLHMILHLSKCKFQYHKALPTVEIEQKTPSFHECVMDEVERNTKVSCLENG